MSDKLDRFTNRARRVLTLAQEEALRLNHNYIGTEHLFIAMTKVEGGATASLLKRAGLNPRHVRNEIRRESGSGEGSIDTVLPLTPRAGMVLSIAMFFAERDGVEEIEEVHLLLAMLQEGEGLPIRKLAEMGFNVNA